MIIMKYIKTCKCLKCENLIEDEIIEDYICKIDTGIYEYVGNTKWQIEGNDKLRRCLKDDFMVGKLR